MTARAAATNPPAGQTTKGYSRAQKITLFAILTIPVIPAIVSGLILIGTSSKSAVTRFVEVAKTNDTFKEKTKTWAKDFFEDFGDECKSLGDFFLAMVGMD